MPRHERILRATREEETILFVERTPFIVNLLTRRHFLATYSGAPRQMITEDTTMFTPLDTKTVAAEAAAEAAALEAKEQRAADDELRAAVITQLRTAYLEELAKRPPDPLADLRDLL